MAVTLDHAQTPPDPERTPALEPGRRNHWLWLPALLAGALLVAAGVNASRPEPPVDRPSTDMTAEPGGIAVRQDAPQWKFLKLATVGDAGQHWTDSVPARVAIDDARASKIGVPVDGRVTRVMVSLGDAVRAGQPLFAIASPQIAELRTAREQALIELETARLTAQRVEATVASRALPAKDAEIARQRVREAELAVELANEKLASIKVAPGRDHEVVVTSPTGGIVVEKNVLVSQQVAADPAAALIVVADLSSVWTVAEVFEGQAPDIRPGDQAEITTPSIPGETLTGRVLMVSSVGDPDRHTQPVRIQVANADRRLRPNAYARVRFKVRQPMASVEVAASALVSDGDRQYVYVQESPGRFIRRTVVAGSAHEGRLPILSGLAKGEQVVEQGAILLDNQLAILAQ